MAEDLALLRVGQQDPVDECPGAVLRLLEHLHVKQRRRIRELLVGDLLRQCDS